MALSKVNPNFVSQLGRRNLLINGDMRIAQRGATTTGIGQTSGYWACDRVKLFNAGGAGATYTVSQETDGPTGSGFTHSYKVQTTTADTSLPAASYTILRLSNEAQDLLQLGWGTSSAKSLTFSFWVKSNKTGDQTILGATHGSMQQHVKQKFTINSANTWEKKEITFVGNTGTAMEDGNAMGFSIDMYIAAGANYQGGTTSLGVWGTRASTDKAADTLNIANSTSNYFQVTGLQLEVGDTATPFEHRSYGEELAACQRYYQLNIANTGFTNTTTVCRLGISGVTSMRAQPSISIVSATGVVEDFGIANRNLVSLGGLSAGSGGTFFLGGAVDATITSSSSSRSHLLFPGAIAMAAEL
jgi:hypothetical protein